MANNYTQFSIDVAVTDLQREWLESQLAETHVILGPDNLPKSPIMIIDVTDQSVDYKAVPRWIVEAIFAEREQATPASGFFYDEDSLCDYGCHAFEAEIIDHIDNQRLWVRSEESGNPDIAAYFLFKFLSHFAIDMCLLLETAYTCSKPRPGEFGGAAHFITRDNIKMFSTSQWLVNREEEWQNDNHKSIRKPGTHIKDVDK